MMKTKMHVQDMITYSVLLAASIFLYCVLIPQQIVLRSFSWSAGTGFTSQTFPKVLTVCLFVISLLGIVQTWIKMMKARKDGAHAGEERTAGGLYETLIPAIIFLACIAFVYLFSSIGFIFSAIIMMPVMLALFKVRTWHYYVSVYAFAALLYLLFRVLLKVPLP